MKVIKRISLFLAMAGLMFSAGSYATLRAEQFFYPNRYDRNEKNASANGSGAGAFYQEEEKTREQVIETAVEKVPVITADTLYLIEEVNLSDGTIREKEEQIPVKYIGLDRLSLIEELEAYDRNPALSDLKLGFQNIELSSFSRDRVVICKYYRPEPEEKGFYLMVADHFVIVYEEDKKTIHMNTDILLESLSGELQTEIIGGKYIENEQELYNFLESYSS
ncbi:MAG: hypothetical protein NC341_02465 [Blautia sp.]|nr:hypothetical protein [Blautia sp.]MCM1200481.1 hypothetical protein [Bacteroides fragilis]